MNRKLRITFRNGDVRIVELQPGRTLIEVWTAIKRDNAMVGDLWCAQFDFIAMIEVVELPDAAGEQKSPPMPAQSQPDPVDQLAALVGRGAWLRLPGEA